jgi:hypothetical protein
MKQTTESSRRAHGRVLSVDAGTLTVANTFRIEDGEFLSSTIVEMHRKHPDADGSIFCDVVLPALS